ncbi:MAG: nitrile hydratase subunit beta [Actinomycetota bacterium]
MNGVHDMGGAHGFGAVVPEPAEPVFHAEWERRVFALALAMGSTGEWNVNAARFARESIPPADYLSSSYYGIWLAGLERLLAQRGLVTREEIDAGRPLQPARAVSRTLARADVAATVGRGRPARRDPTRPARFAVGDRVRARNIHPVTHTRLPRYVRGHVGLVELVHGFHVFPDTDAHGRGEDPQWLYTVRFNARELWGVDADPTVAVSVDAFEPYLDPAP